MRVLRFDGFTLDLSRRALLRAGEAVALRPQVFDVLAYLAEHRGRMISKKELFDAVWAGAARTDDSVVQCIVDIREALGDGEHRLVRTVPRRGYLFTCELAEVPGNSAPPEQDPALRPETARTARVEALPAAGEAGAGTPREWQRILIAASLALTVLVAGGWLLWAGLNPRPAAALTMMARPSIAVLPAGRLGDEADPALATLADEIAAGIWRSPRGFTPDIKPTSAVKDERDDPKAIGRKLGVRYVVRNLVRREGERLHITVQLVEAENARQVWVGDFDYRFGQAGAQNRAAARIGQTLAAEVLRAEVKRPLPAVPEATHFVMLGRRLMTDEFDAKSNGEAIAYFEKALAADPEHVLALVHYARATGTRRLSGWMAENEVDERLAKAAAAIDLAIRREPTAAGSHLTRGTVLRARGEHAQAIEAFERALELNPNFFPARAELGRSLIDVGQAERAIAEFKKAIEANPTDVSPHMWYYWAGLAALHLPNRHAEAMMWLEKSHAANPHFDNTFRLMAVALDDAGQEEAARRKVIEFLNLRPSATLDDWKMPNARSHPEVAERRAHIRATLKRLGVPEAHAQAVSRP
jgi:DNA-binding winged helix-turn-helix (wHTH) protein/tetratricopeptide (TPR) repeat protein